MMPPHSTTETSGLLTVGLFKNIFFVNHLIFTGLWVLIGFNDNVRCGTKICSFMIFFYDGFNEMKP